MSGKPQFHFLGFVATISLLSLMKQILFFLMYTNPLNWCPQSSSIWVPNSCPNLEIPKSTEASLCDGILILLQTPGHALCPNDVRVVIWGGQKTLPDNVGDLNAALWVYFAMYQLRIVGLKSGHSQNCRSLQRQDRTVSPSCRQNKYTSYYATAFVKCN